MSTGCPVTQLRCNSSTTRSVYSKSVSASFVSWSFSVRRLVSTSLYFLLRAGALQWPAPPPPPPPPPRQLLHLHLVNGLFPLKRMDNLEYIWVTLLRQLVHLVMPPLQMVVRAMSLIAEVVPRVNRSESLDQGSDDIVHDLCDLRTMETVGNDLHPDTSTLSSGTSGRAAGRAMTCVAGDTRWSSWQSKAVVLQNVHLELPSGPSSGW